MVEAILFYLLGCFLSALSFLFSSDKPSLWDAAKWTAFFIITIFSWGIAIYLAIYWAIVFIKYLLIKVFG